MLRSAKRPQGRYTLGGDDFLLIELSQSMSLESNLAMQGILKKSTDNPIPGVIDVCSGNASVLVRFDPDTVPAQSVIEAFGAIEREVLSRDAEPYSTRIVDIPVYFNDPWTYECMMRYRERVPEPGMTDIEYLVEINDLADDQALIDALTSAPQIVSLVGFLPGIFSGYQLVDRDRQLQAPKYLAPRIDTPERAFALGGAYSCIYPSESPGGYPIFGRAAGPVYNPAQNLPDFQDGPALVAPGDLANYRAVDREEYDAIGREVAKGTFTYLIKEVTFEPAACYTDSVAYGAMLQETLYGR